MKDQETLLRKVQNLLALAGNNPNENEAKQAALKAQELIAKYNLDLSKAAGDKVEYALVKAVHSGNEGYRLRLSAIIGPSFRCKVLIVGGTVAFFGHKQDAEACTEVFNYLYRVSHNLGIRLLVKARKEGRPTSGITNSYWTGFMDGLKSSMDAQCKALAIVVPPDVHEEAENRWHLTNSKEYVGGQRQQTVRQGAYSQGFEDGKNAMGKRALENS